MSIISCLQEVTKVGELKNVTQKETLKVPSHEHLNHYAHTI